MENKNRFSAVIIVILVIALLIVGSYIFYDKILSKNESSTSAIIEEKTKNSENVKIEDKFYNIVVKNICAETYNEDCIDKEFEDFYVNDKNYKISFTKDENNIYFNFGDNKIELFNQTIETISLMDGKYLVLGIDPTGGHKYYIYDLNLKLIEEVGNSLGDVLNENSNVENWVLDKYNLIYKTCEGTNTLYTYNLHFEDGKYEKVLLSTLKAQCSSQR